MKDVVNRNDGQEQAMLEIYTPLQIVNKTSIGRFAQDFCTSKQIISRTSNFPRELVILASDLAGDHRDWFLGLKRLALYK